MEFDKNSVKLKIAISKIKEENDIVMENKIKKVIKAIWIVLAGFALSTGVVFASTKVYEKIWKEPQKHTYEERKNNLPPEITEEEKQKIITEEEAKEKAIEILNKLGYENQTINKVELKKGYGEDEPIYYMVKTKLKYEQGLAVQINAKNGKFMYFGDMDFKDKCKYKNYKIEKLSDNEISKIAIDIYNKLGMEENEYKITDIRTSELYSENQIQSSNLSCASFYKYYDGVANKYETFNVSFISIDGEIFLNVVNLFEDNSYQNNEIVIPKEDAIEIAKNKEKEFSNYDITNVECELSIEKMNAFIYQIENNDYTHTLAPDNSQEQYYYETEDILRKVWKIKIEHNLKIKDFGGYDIENKKRYIKEGMSKYYYVDCTTGEIIGGDSILD